MSATGTQNWSEAEQRAVRAQLARIVNSGSFQQSQRRRRFLEYLVDETLGGRGDRLKGYTIAVEVFDRPQSFDPVIDPVVRVEAGRLREKLRDYYNGEGARDPVRIDLLKGTYAPLFEFRQTADALPPSKPADSIALVTQLNEAGAAPADTDNEVQNVVQRQNGTLLRRASVIAAAVLLVLGAVALWQYTFQPRQSAGKPDGSRGPVVAVLPFTNLSGDPSQEYFSDGLTEDILTELSRARDLVVLARDTTFGLKGRAVDIAKLRNEFGADYALEGGVQRAGGHLRVTSQLIDTHTGAHVWADRFDREMSDLLLVQDEMVSEIVSKLTGGFGVINVAESRSSKRKSPDQIEAYDLVLRAQDVMRPEWSRRTFAAAKDLLRQAIVLDPENARAHRELAYLSAIGWVFRFDAAPASHDEILAQAVKSVQLGPDDARARMVAAAAYFWTGQLDLFEHEAQKALSLAPYDAEILATIGAMYAKSGQWDRGVALVEKGNDLNSYAATGWYQSTVALALYIKGDYERAVAMLRQSTDQGTFYIYLEYIPILGQLGKKDDAGAMWKKLVAEEPGATAETFRAWFRLWNTPPADIERFMDGVTKSGVLETSETTAK